MDSHDLLVYEKSRKEKELYSKYCFDELTELEYENEIENLNDIYIKKQYKLVKNKLNIDDDLSFFVKNEAKQMNSNKSDLKFIKNENADNRLYYFRFTFKGKKYYKIGITSQTLKDRYGTDYNKIEKILYDEKIDGAMKAEKDIKKQFSDDIFPLAYLNGGGHTETFDRDVLDLDN